jgi:hypothetical protein
MTMQTMASSVSPETAPMSHVITAATLGGGFSSTLVWLLQTFGHVSPPDAADQWFTAIGIVAASWLLQKMAD